MLLAYIVTILKNFIYGTTFFFIGALSETLDVLDILSLRFLMGFAVLWVLKLTKILKIEVGIKDIFKRTKRHQFVVPLLLTALFEPVLYMVFETLGVQLSTDVTVGVMLSLTPIFCCIGEEIFLKEKSSVLQKIFLALGIGGVIYISVNTAEKGGQDTALGFIFLLLAVICGSMFMVFSRKSSKHFSAFEVTYFSSMLGAVAFNGVNVIRHIFRGDILHYFDPYFNLQNLGSFAFLAIGATIIATAMNNYSMSKIHVSTVSAFSGIITIVTIFIGVLCGERLYTFHYIGFALILLRMVGVSYISLRKEKDKKSK